MSSDPPESVTRLLQDWSAGDERAPGRLMPLIYEELRGLARDYLRRERSGHTLQPTALIHEAYLRLVDQTSVSWENRAHFFGSAARAMRRILVDHARAHQAARRGGGVPKVSFDEAANVAAPETDFVALDGALDSLAIDYPRQSEVVELKFFGGFEMREIAEVLQTSERTVMRDWDFARRWLKRELDGADARQP